MNFLTILIGILITIRGFIYFSSELVKLFRPPENINNESKNLYRLKTAYRSFINFGGVALGIYCVIFGIGFTYWGINGFSIFEFIDKFDVTPYLNK